MLRWPWSGFTFIAFLVTIFCITYAITRFVVGSQVHAAPQPSITWGTSTPAAMTNSLAKPENKNLSETPLLLETPTMSSSQASATPTIADTSQEVTPPATSTLPLTATPSPLLDEPTTPTPGGTCISGSIIDHYHEARGQGWGITVTSAGVSQTMMADSQGRFNFANLGAGVWQVTLSLPSGWRPFTPSSFSVTLSGNGTSCAQVRFKVEAPACVEIIKVDKNGPQSEVGLPGWTFTGIDTNGSQVSGLTNGLGRIRFAGLRPGRWTFTEQSQVGWIPAEGESGSKTIELKSPQDLNQCEILKFVNEQIHDSCLTVQKVDETGQPIADWQITLARKDGTQPSQNYKTNEQGQVTFSNLPLGDWTITEEPKEGWRPITPVAQTVTLTTPSKICTNVTFQNTRGTCVEGYKINHFDTGLADWNIFATNKATSETKQTITDKQGFFRFDNLDRGIWIISEQLKPEWEALTPSQFEVEAVEPRTPGQCYQVRFKNRFPYSCLDVYKLDAFDKAGLPGWNITVQPAYGNNPIIKTTDGIGHVRFDHLLPGEYTVSEEAQPGWFPVTESTQRVNLEATGFCEVVTFENCQNIFGSKDGACKK